VEPLSDVAWARVERGLWARMDGSVTLQVEPPARRRWLWIAAPIVAAAAAIVLVVVTRDGAPTERIAEISGSDANDVRVVAPPNAPTTASFNDAHIELAPASAIVLRSSGTLLERGSAWFAVAPRIDRPAFVVLAGDTKVRVLGTKFRVARNEKNDHVAVEVDHGTVEVQFRGSLKRINAHETWTSERPDEVAPTTTTAAADPDVIELAPTRRPVKKAEKKVEPKIDDKPDTKKVELDDERAKYDRLSALEKRDPNGAIAGYLELSQRSGPWAANALYAAGRLAADRNDARATTLLTVYLRRFPTGPNAEDARRLLARRSK
jgi:hypothetical protein